MTRQARRESGTGIYHVMIRGINKEKIFDEEKDCKKIFYTLKENLDLDIEIYAYCIMPNHLHLLLKSTLSSLTAYMRHVGIVYAQYYNLSRERVGSVFQGRFKSECVETEKYFWNCLKYIHNNPVKANLVRDGRIYYWSSEREYVNETPVLLHRKAFRLYAKRINLPEPEDDRIDHIFIDIKEEEDRQKNEYFEQKFYSFLKEKGIKQDEWKMSVKMMKEFAERLEEEKILPKNMVRKKIKEIGDGSF